MAYNLSKELIIKNQEKILKPPNNPIFKNMMIIRGKYESSTWLNLEKCKYNMMMDSTHPISSKIKMNLKDTNLLRLMFHSQENKEVLLIDR